MGLNVQNELSAESKVFCIGRDCRSNKNQAPMAGPYEELWHALSDNNVEAAKDEIRWLVRDQGKKLDDIRESLGIRKDGSVKPENFAGGLKADNANMQKGLTPAQKEVYRQAQDEHHENARRFQ